ncbi:MAG TPA: peptidoglycan-binding domain-containing protein [Pseudolabrys sp.]|nr:peptidoglycan-binding domain-containing protein [Pseudolabrys sp.]
MRSKDYRSSRAGTRRSGRVAGAAALVGEHPRESVALFVGAAATAIIFVNALFLQQGPHPAPIFTTHRLSKAATHAAAKPPRVVEAKAPAAATAPRNRSQIVGDIQRELAQRGFYDGAIDGVLGAKTDSALRDFAQAAGVKGEVEADEEMLRRISASNVKATSTTQSVPHGDPIAKLLAPSKRVLAVQRALADFGYGQIKPTGTFNPETGRAIEKFERDRHLPVTGKISDQLVRELAAVTGRPLE